MKLKEALGELEAAGTAQNRKVYQRHGAREPLYGVSYANQNKIAKKIGTDHGLAAQLWATGNHDARILATMVADPEQLTVTRANEWVRDCGNYVEVEALAGLVAAAPIAMGRSSAWRDRKGEWVASTGWAIVAHLAMADGQLSDADCRRLLTQIRREVHDRPNRVRHEMNGALIAIGLRNAALHERALVVADAIGDLGVDHGATSCKTPDARSYIERASRRKKK